MAKSTISMVIFNGKVPMTIQRPAEAAGPLMAVKQLALLVHPDKTQHPRAVEIRGAGADAQSVGHGEEHGDCSMIFI
jgi:hypothetical protein